VLTPLHEGLCQLFDEMDKVAPGQGEAAPVNGKASAVWESWKKDLGGKAAEIIDALLVHGEMSVAQLRVAAKCGQQTVYDITHKMNKLGLINRNGGRYSLKKL
jgi:hypothetical protein